MRNLYAFLLVALSISAFESRADDHSAPSQWNDIKTWKLVGDRFAAGYDGNQHMLAMYDLSYPPLLGVITLGRVGDGKVNRADLVEAWKLARSHALTASGEDGSSGIPDDMRNAIASAGDEPEKALQAAEVPADWWKGLPWKATPRAEPESFRITDLDLKRAGIGAAFTKDFKKLIHLVLDLEDSVQLSDEEALDSLQFVRDPKGGFRILWSAPASLSRAGVSRPRKLLDFKNTKTGFYKNVLIQAITEGLTSAIGLIPVPVVPALIETAISELSRFYALTETEHLEIFRELVTEVMEGSALDAVLEQLSSGDREHILSAFKWARVNPLSFWQWLFSGADSYWNKAQNQSAKCSAQSRSWLTSNGWELFDFNSRFTAGSSQGSRILFLEGEKCAKGKHGPGISIDYYHPGDRAIERMNEEGIRLELEFASYMVPTFGTVIRMVYDLFVQSPINNTQYWEGRLMQALELRPEGPEFWSFELGILQGQRINPLEIGLRDMAQLILERRQLIGE